MTLDKQPVDFEGLQLEVQGQLRVAQEQAAHIAQLEQQVNEQLKRTQEIAIPNPEITRSLEVSVERYEAELQRLMAIKAIVIQHPEWIEQEPQLAQLLQQCELISTREK
jgi:FKBP-type peptidyl-prolyl cis-trans isomerase (trigger factor)